MPLHAATTCNNGEIFLSIMEAAKSKLSLENQKGLFLARGFGGNRLLSRSVMNSNEEVTKTILTEIENLFIANEFDVFRRLWQHCSSKHSLCGNKSHPETSLELYEQESELV